ncbi:hypothetical protein [Halobacteriovorax sp.]|uniref:hypothetical protein n=1 Tax=Halobacteriovorax sp. TaxID=2020862 RepID=UPI00356A2CF2
MKNLILSAMVIATTSSYADFKSIEVSDFTGNYRKPDGSATAAKLTIPESITSRINIELKGVEDGYLLEFGNEEFHFKNPPSFINDIDSASWSKINYTTKSTQMNGSIDFMSSNVADSEMNIQKLSAKCYENRAFPEMYGLQLLDACLTNSKFSVSYFRSNQLSSAYNILLELPGIENVVASDISIKNATLSTSKNSFKFAGKVDLGISANIKIEGKSQLDKENNKVILKIDKAKASFLNIKGRLFDELKKSESKTFKVNEPYIYIYLK